MQNRWSDADAAGFVARYGAEWGEDLALRTYTSQLLGGEVSLVLHGGGNTSVKRTVTDRFGDPLEVIAIKASGYDLATVPPEGHVAVRLDHLRRLRSIPELSDEEIVNELRTHLLDAGAPTPSIETPVHALVPHRYVDHTHADVVLALTNQVGGDDLVREAMGPDVIVLPDVPMGTTLAGRRGTALVSNGAVMRSPSYRMVSTLGQSSIHQTVMRSLGFRLRGGLVGATGGSR